MDKKLPKVFVNKINKKLLNNDITFYSWLSVPDPKVPSSNNDLDITDIGEKINKMFHSPSYVYKIDAEVFTKDGRKLNKSIIGKVDNKLITLDEDFIPIDNIKNIKY